MIAYTSKNFQINTSIDLKVFEQLFFNELRIRELQFYLESHLWVHAGIPATHKILALQTPLQDVTCGGSGVRLNTHTWPTQPSLLHTQTSLEPCPLAKVGAAQVNCKPARVFRIGRGPTNSGQGLLSADNAVSRDTSTQVRARKNIYVKEFVI